VCDTLALTLTLTLTLTLFMEDTEKLEDVEDNSFLEGPSVGIVFGRERSGLTNEEVNL
jgi:tRNA C32,U32 (ribose-2'-O)-methylase TrmJ